MSKGVTYSAPAGTEVSTVIAGETVRFEFSGRGSVATFTTDDPQLIAILDDCATSEAHPIGFAPKEA